MFRQLNDICTRPEPFSVYTAATLWNDEHISGKMLECHLDGSIDAASRRKDFIDKSVAWISTRFNVGHQIRIADFGCGPGLYTTPLAKLGASVTGIDFSARSIAYAKKTALAENLAVNYVRQNYLEFETTEKFDLIIMIFCDLCALSPAQRRIMLHKFSSMLADGGKILLDVHTVNFFAQREEVTRLEYNPGHGFWSKNPYYCFMNSFKYSQEKISLEKYSIIEEQRTWEVFNWLQYFEPKSLSEEFHSGGLRIEEYYSDVTGTAFSRDSMDMAVVATRETDANVAEVVKKLPDHV